MEFVYEVVDYTYGEQYYPLGLFKTLEQALHEIEVKESKHHAISPFVDQEYEEIVVMKRGIGWTQGGKRVAEIHRKEVYYEEEDEFLWERTENTDLAISK